MSQPARLLAGHPGAFFTYAIRLSGHFPGRTRLKKLLHGNPLSRAKDHSCREVLVTWLIIPNMSRAKINAVNAVLADVLCVTL